jgi:arginine/serine-rich splicing factor 4/5/6
VRLNLPPSLRYLFTSTFSVLEYLSREDADRAVKDLDGRELRGKLVRVVLDDHVSKLTASAICGPNLSFLQRGAEYRRDDRRDDRDRYRDDRYRDDRYRRDRSRSPRRGEDRRPRSPPKKDGDKPQPPGYDDYRRGGYEERRPDDYYYDRRREDPDRKRDDRRRDEKDDRYDDRPSRHANGDAGWSR